MCRSIKRLHAPGQFAAPQESDEAALQFVRKISGFRKPSKVNRQAFDLAVREIAEATERLLAALGQPANGKAYETSDTAGENLKA